MTATHARRPRVALIGFGLIGRQRLTALRSLPVPADVIGVVDPAITPSTLGQPIALLPSVEELIARKPDLVVIATPHDVTVPVAEQVLASGSRVLIEKPFGRTVAESQRLLAAQTRPGQIRVGFNYRFLAGVAALFADVAAGRFGELISMSIVLGHGGSPGDERTWKLDPVRAGGGCLIDPGVHALDLLRVALGADLTPVGGRTWRGFWGTGIEEEAHVVLATPRGAIARAEISVVRWRSTFRIEVNGTEGYGVVTGRGRSYGPQEYRRGRRWGWMDGGSQADSEEVVLTDPGEDSFARETACVLGMAEGPSCSGEESLEVMRLYEAVSEEVLG